jgi:hypothetical protein
LNFKKDKHLKKKHFKRLKLWSEKIPLCERTPLEERGGTMFVLYEILITEYTIIIETKFYSNFLN